MSQENVEVVRRAVAAGPDFQLAIDRVEAIGPDRVLAFMLVTVTGRASGIPQDSRPGNVYDLAGGKIQRIQIFVDRDQALEAAGLRE